MKIVAPAGGDFRPLSVCPDSQQKETQFCQSSDTPKDFDSPEKKAGNPSGCHVSGHCMFVGSLREKSQSDDALQQFADAFCPVDQRHGASGEVRKVCRRIDVEHSIDRR